jgi:hypothetical protein
MTTNELADTLTMLTMALLLVMTAWGNDRAMLTGSAVSLAGMAVFLGIHGKSLGRRGLRSALIGCTAAAGIAAVALLVRR